MSDQQQMKKRHYGQEILRETNVIRDGVDGLKPLLDLLEKSDGEEGDPIETIIDLLQELTTDVKQLKAHLMGNA